MADVCPSCREPIDYPSGDGCAAMTSHIEEPFYIGVEEVKENEDGSNTYTFHMSDEVAKDMQALGLKLILHCGIAQVDLQDVFNWILEHGVTDVHS